MSAVKTVMAWDEGGEGEGRRGGSKQGETEARQMKGKEKGE